ncbi:ZINC FINGER HOMEODOMAIN 6, homeobox protein 24 [Hibiscus trionum]|uniref:ZINC FINGER HOMEODOMAIN 6, homeobox protein 24 n=1 Tax=Hibiscus trionum TaxID=183268 RepID=A0A9W7LNX4_HIBTR|nr:ZINC FINGER HOMEODOMAIN 6, homeobox protein 24 [Hibiscus trionum]
MEKEYPNDVYKECLRNHAASLGSYATDGCGEFTLDDTSLSTLQCAACGCHRNFHRKVSYCSSTSRSRGELENNTVERIDYGDEGGSRGRHPIAGEYSTEGRDRSGKKRFRTKFTAEQKEKMLEFAEKLGWKLQRREEEDEVERFCRGIGVSRQVFKVWMHNHKNSSAASSLSTCNVSSLTTP